jgi:hypothetical protein
METTNNEMSAERSLEIIRKSIEESRRRITQGSWKSMMFTSISVAAIALLVGHLWAHTSMGQGANGLWGLLGLVSVVDRKWLAPRPKLPETFVSKTISQVWGSVAIMVAAIAVSGLLLVELHIDVPLPAILDGASQQGSGHTPFVSLIILLMGIAGMITGRILKSRVITVACFVSGLLGSILALVYAGPQEMVVMAGVAVLGLIVPALVIKMKKG